MEVTTQAPSGTKLRIDSDRQFEGQQGDSVLRVQGQSEDGSQVFDATYVEMDPQEAAVLARLARSVIQPSPQLQDKIAQEVQATFASRIGGRDAQQIAHIAAQAVQVQVAAWFGWTDQPTDQAMQPLERLAERLERSAAKRSKAPAFTSGGNGEAAQTTPAGSRQR